MVVLFTPFPRIVDLVADVETGIALAVWRACGRLGDSGPRWEPSLLLLTGRESRSEPHGSAALHRSPTRAGARDVHDDERTTSRLAARQIEPTRAVQPVAGAAITATRERERAA